MKAVIKFNLDDPDDQMAYRRVNLSEDMASVLWEFMFNSKKNIERQLEAADADKVDRYSGLDLCYEKLNELLSEHGINLETIIQ